MHEHTGNILLSQQRERCLAQGRNSYTISIIGWHKKENCGGFDLIFFLPASSFPEYSISSFSQLRGTALSARALALFPAGCGVWVPVVTLRSMQPLTLLNNKTREFQAF